MRAKGPQTMQIDSVAPLFDKSAFVDKLKDGTEATPVQPGAEPIIGDTQGTGKSFGQFLQDALSEVNQAQLHASDTTARFAAGEPMDVHQVMIAAQEASISLNLAMQVRNKLVDAYQEIMRVNV